MAEKPKKVMDVSKPSEIKAMPTSKPVIIGHGPMMKDPMVSDSSVDLKSITRSDDKQKPLEPDTEPSNSEEPQSPSTEEQTKTEDQQPDTPTEQTSSSEPEVPADKPEPDTETEPEPSTPSPVPESGPPEPEEPEQQTTETESSQLKDLDENDLSDSSGSSDVPTTTNAAVESVLGDAQGSKAAEVAKDERDTKLAELVASTKYRIPVGQKRSHHIKGEASKKILVLLAAIVVFAIAGYLAIDAGVVKTSIELPFHIFKQKQAEAPTPAVVATPTVKTTTPSTTKTTPTTDTTAPPVPTGFVSYQFTDGGILFDYPSTWGAPSETTDKGYVKRGTEQTYDGGIYAAKLTFSKNPSIAMVVTSGVYLPATTTKTFSDYLQWCTSSTDSKIYSSILTYKTTNGTDVPDVVTCNQGPLTNATKIDATTIQQLKDTDPVSSTLIGDIYTKNLTSKALPVLHIQDLAMTNSADILKLLPTVVPAASATTKSP